MSELSEGHIVDQIDRLRNGEPLDHESIRAISEGISKLFDDVATLWGKRFFISASVPLDERHDLIFSKWKDRWRFVVSAHDGRRREGISNSSLNHRILAASCLPGLETALMDNRGLQRDSLLEAFDTVSEFAEETGDD